MSRFRLANDPEAVGHPPGNESPSRDCLASGHEGSPSNPQKMKDHVGLFHANVGRRWSPRTLSAGLLAGVLAGLLSLPLATPPAGAYTLEEFQFSDPARAEEFKRLTEELRCLVCQNESLAGSQADLAQDLREEVYRLLQSGKSRQEVIDFLVERYGDFVLYDPPLKPSTYALWFGPLLLAGVGGLFLFLTLRNKQEAREQELSAEEQQRLRALLADDSTPTKKDKA